MANLITINTKVEGLDKLLNIVNRTNAALLSDSIRKILIIEAEKFINYVKMQIPQEYIEYANSLNYVEIPNEAMIIINTAYSDERWQASASYRKTKIGATGLGDEDYYMGASRFGNKVEWALYTCPKRKYAGGKLSLEYNGPDFLKQEWQNYKNTFISSATQKITRLLKGDKM